MNWELGKWSHFSILLISHFAAVFVFMYGSSTQIAAMILLHLFNFWISGTVTYHRLLSHRSWLAPRWFELFGTFIGVFSFTGSSITRTIIHRQHHLFSDTESDPHSPLYKSKLQLYFPMFYFGHKLDSRLARDLMRDKFHVWIHKKYLLIILTTTLLFYYFFGPVWTMSLVLAPGVFSWITIFLGNYLCHIGVKKGQTEDRSKNNFFIVLIGFGEGWHGNHHDDPQNASFAKGQWDPGWWLIKLVQRIS